MVIRVFVVPLPKEGLLFYLRLSTCGHGYRYRLEHAKMNLAHTLTIYISIRSRVSTIGESYEV